MKIKNCILAFAMAVCVAVAGCTSFEHTSTTTSPTATGVSALMGSWTSATASSVIPSPSTCTDFKWNATEQTATTAKGSFSATCAGDLKVAGTASGTLTAATVVEWGANGTATVGAGLPCAITLTGTAELGTNSIRVPYSGSTCAGPVSGVEILNKK
jgi:hypothetical protein